MTKLALKTFCRSILCVTFLRVSVGGTNIKCPLYPFWNLVLSLFFFKKKKTWLVSQKCDVTTLLTRQSFWRDNHWHASQSKNLIFIMCYHVGDIISPQWWQNAIIVTMMVILCYKNKLFFFILKNSSCQ